VVKARARGDNWLADAVYSGVPASWLGKSQEIEIGPMSGASNVLHFLQSRGMAHDTGIISMVLAHAKKSQRLLSEEEVATMVNRAQEPAP